MSYQPEHLGGIEPASEGTVHSFTTRYGRRAVILGAAAAGAGLAADLVASGTAEAAPDSGTPVLLGKSNTTHGATIVNSTGATGLSGRTVTDGQSGVSGFDTSPKGSFGIYGKSVNGTGVLGSSAHRGGVAGLTFTTGESGVSGLDFCPTKGAHGVYGQSNFGFGVFGISFKGSGVGGESNTPGEAGLIGVDMAPHGGMALFAQSHHGTAVYATSAEGTALHVFGKAHFSNSGVVNVRQGSRIAKVTVSGITPSSMVLATIQKPQAGVYIEAAEPGNGTFTVTLSKSASSLLPVAWFVLA